MLVTVTVAPGTAAPVLSLTVPAMLPETAWARAGAGGRATARTKAANANDGNVDTETRRNHVIANPLQLLGRRLDNGSSLNTPRHRVNESDPGPQAWKNCASKCADSRAWELESIRSIQEICGNA